MFKLIVSVVVLACLGTWAAASPLTRVTAQGNVTGYASSTHYIFKGVPFAMAPVGALRFAPPQALPERTSTLVLPTSSKPACNSNEDCLYLDIYVPISVTTAAPVMFWIHGGAYTYDGSYNYDGQYITNNTNVILVSINYRLGAFGFVALDELLDRDGTTGNYGHQDQRFAMQWVSDNIVNFGGSPTKMTIAGQSAGSHSVCTHLGNPRSSGLYRSAIMQSTYNFCNVRSLSTAVSNGNSWAKNLNCTSSGDALLDCITNLPASKIFASFNGDVSGQVWYPCADMYEFNHTSGAQNLNLPGVKKVPVIVGTNSNENTGNSQTFACAARSVSNTLSPLKSVFTYYFTYGSPAHGGELQYFWPKAFGSPLSGARQTVSNILVSYWISFVKNSVPTSKVSGTSVWNKYNTTTDLYNTLDLTASMADNFFPGRSSC